MSKYEQRGAYHYEEFRRTTSIYRAHVLDLVAKIEEFVPARGDILEVGAGEGLILDQLGQRGFVCDGCDVDVTAVLLAKQKGNSVELGSIELYIGRAKKTDAVLLCDVLEHVENPIAVMAAAREIADVVVIAIPDREDRHAIHDVDPAAVKLYMEPSGYECVHQSQRHARHLLIFKRNSS